MPLYILDTDHISLISRGGIEGQRIVHRLSQASSADKIAVTIISYEEQMRGWMAEIAATRSIDQQSIKYSKLQRMLRYYCGALIIQFDDEAVSKFQVLWIRHLRIGTMDLKIAAIALANNAVLLTRNSAHFEKITELKHEDWSAL